jgi:hypothetical protein
MIGDIGKNKIRIFLKNDGYSGGMELIPFREVISKSWHIILKQNALLTEFTHLFHDF